MKSNIFAILLLFFTLLHAAMRGQVASPTTKRSFERVSSSAERARNENRDEDAIALYRRALVLKPLWPEGLWYLGALLYEKQRYPEARDVLRQFMATQKDAGPGWALLGMSEFQCREYSRALDHLQRAMLIGMGGRKDMVHTVSYTVATLLTRFERYDDSLNLLFRMLGSGEDKTALVDPVGLAALRIPLLPSEVPLDRRDLVHRAGEASIVSQTPQFKDADTIFKQVENTYPREPGVHFLYGVYLMDVRPQDAIQELKRELEVSPSHVPARLRLAEVDLHNQEFERASTLAQEAVSLEPDYPPAHLVLGEVEVGKGALDAGIKELENAEAKQPTTPRVHWDLLRAYLKVGRTEDAEHEKEVIKKIQEANSSEGEKSIHDEESGEASPK